MIWIWNLFGLLGYFAFVPAHVAPAGRAIPVKLTTPPLVYPPPAPVIQPGTSLPCPSFSALSLITSHTGGNPAFNGPPLCFAPKIANLPCIWLMNPLNSPCCTKLATIASTSNISGILPPQITPSFGESFTTPGGLIKSCAVINIVFACVRPDCINAAESAGLCQPSRIFWQYCAAVTRSARFRVGAFFELGSNGHWYVKHKTRRASERHTYISQRYNSGRRIPLSNSHFSFPPSGPNERLKAAKFPNLMAFTIGVNLSSTPAASGRDINGRDGNRPSIMFDDIK